MKLKVESEIAPRDLLEKTTRVFQLGAEKSRSLDRDWDLARGTPVFTAAGRYTTRGWTEWTQGFQYGSLLLAADGIGDASLLDLGRRRVLERMLPHVTHTGVHDHGFNNVSTYGTLARLRREGRVEAGDAAAQLWLQALAVSGAVQAARWSPVFGGGGYIYSFNGPHSLFIDTLRTLRALAVAHRLGHALLGENDARINLLGRAVEHGLITDRYLVFHGESEHTYDVRGRTAHEGTFNRNDGRFRSRATQQGYSPFSTWTRGLAWAMLGFAEQLEFLDTLSPEEFAAAGIPDKETVMGRFLRAARDTCEHYLEEASAADGIVYWDDGAPGLRDLGDWRAVAADPFNDREPVDASAAAIAAQALLRLGHFLGEPGGGRYRRAGLALAAVLFAAPYLSTAADHQGLLLHSVYHWPNHWDFVPPGRAIPCGESSLWGDYHLLELAHLVQRLAVGGTYPVFFNVGGKDA